VPTSWRTGWKGPSRMKGNFHVRFLEGGGLGTARSYSVIRFQFSLRLLTWPKQLFI